MRAGDLRKWWIELQREALDAEQRGETVREAWTRGAIATLELLFPQLLSGRPGLPARSAHAE
jgi:hypothetical protein